MTKDNGCAGEVVDKVNNEANVKVSTEICEKIENKEAKVSTEKVDVANLDTGNTITKKIEVSEVSAKEPTAKVDVCDVKNDNAHTVDSETVDAIPKVVIEDDSKDEITIVHALAVVKNSPFMDLTQDEIKVLGHFPWRSDS